MFFKKTSFLNSEEKKVVKILDAGIKAVIPSQALKKQVFYNKQKKELIIQRKKFKVKKRIFVIGAGKASSLMAKKIEKIIGLKNIEAGIINSNNGFELTKKIIINKARHPIPDKNGLLGAKKILELKKKYSIEKNDVVLCLISGGGSALMPLPVPSISLNDLIKTNKVLVKKVSEIHEVNTIRKHLSLIKGGKLAQHFAPAKIISLIISDVVGDDLSFIASGPTVPDKTSFKNAWSIIKKNNIENELPKQVIEYIKNNVGKKINETPKKLPNSFPFLIATNKQALKAMKKKAIELKMNPIIKTNKIAESVEKTSEKIVKLINKTKKPCVYLMGGETTIKIIGKTGKGGRNQELVLRVLAKLEKNNTQKKFVFASIGTDGIDYIKEAAGGIINQATLNKVKKQKIDLNKYIKKHDSYNALKKINGLLITGKTGTNVGDLIVLKIN